VNTIIYNLTHKIPFRDSKDIAEASEDMNCQINLEVKSTKAILLSCDRIDLCVGLNAEAIISKYIEKDLMTDIKVIEVCKI